VLDEDSEQVTVYCSIVFKLENIPWWGKTILWGRGKRAIGGEKYTKYNKINNNSKYFRGQNCCLGGFPPCSSPSCGPDRFFFSGNFKGSFTLLSVAERSKDHNKATAVTTKLQRSNTLICFTEHTLKRIENEA